MKYDELREWSEKAGNWAADYHATLRDRPVMANIAPGEFSASLPESPPEDPEPMEAIFADFAENIPGAMTHWQHPRFFAYFPANAAPASILAEQLANSMGCNAMLWQTSPAATELEQRMVGWLRDALGLPTHFTGLINDSATVSSLCAILTMRERAHGWTSSHSGLARMDELRVYASPENHFSVDKAVRVSGIGQNNLVKPPVLSDGSMDPCALDEAITRDKEAGLLPAGVVVSVGGTSTGSSDRVSDILAVAQKHNLYTHVDAAWAGSAMICEEFRHLWDGIENADSVVVNPHKWIGAQLDCSVQFLADPAPQERTLGQRPEYLKTRGDTGFVNFNELTIPLGRRFRALKLWFVLRAYGLSGIRQMIRSHGAWISALQERFRADPEFTIEFTSPFALFGFRYAPRCGDPDVLTTALCEEVNRDGRVFLTQTVANGRNAIRVAAGTFACEEHDVLSVYDVVKDVAGRMVRS